MKKFITFVTLAVFVVKTFGGACSGIMICTSENSSHIELSAKHSHSQLECSCEKNSEDKNAPSCKNKTCLDILLSDGKGEPSTKTLQIGVPKISEANLIPFVAPENPFKINSARKHANVGGLPIYPQKRTRFRCEAMLPLII